MKQRSKSNEGEKSCQGFFRVSKKQILLISEIALRNEVILSPQGEKSLSECYAILKSILGNGLVPFEIKGENGLLKKITDVIFFQNQEITLITTFLRQVRFLIISN